VPSGFLRPEKRRTAAQKKNLKILFSQKIRPLKYHFIRANFKKLLTFFGHILRRIVYI